MSAETNPYIISADVNRLVRSWATQNKLTIPDEGFFRESLQETGRVIGTYFNSVETISEAEMVAGMKDMAARSSVPIISLDRAYVDASFPNIVGYLDITRAVDENLDSSGIKERPDTKPVHEQIKEIVRRLSTDRVAVLDDVLFGGDTHTEVKAWLLEHGIRLEEVLVGVAIQEGVDKLDQAGISVKSTRLFTSVIDEVCERDFVAGVPMSGRTVVTNEGEVFGAPYFLPFGRPEKWASIPAENADAFSDYCLAQSIMLWEQINTLSETTIPTHAVPKPIFRLKPSSSVVASLQEVKEKRK